VGALVVIILILLVLGGAAFLCLFVTNGPATNAGPVIQKTYDFNGTLAGYDTVSLDVTNINGFVNVIEGSGDTYDISVDAHGTDKDFERYQVQFSPTDSSGVKNLKLEIKDTREPRTLNTRYNADITVTVPKGKKYDASIVTVNGDADLAQLDCGQVKMATVNGELSSAANSTNLTMVTVNGNIVVNTQQTQGGMFLNTVNGGVGITVPKDAPLSLNAHLVNGAISEDIPLVISEKSRVNLVGQTANYTSGIYIEATLVNGNIDIRGR